MLVCTVVQFCLAVLDADVLEGADGKAVPENVGHADENHVRILHGFIRSARFERIHIHHALIVARAFRQIFRVCRLDFHVENLVRVLHIHIEANTARIVVDENRLLVRHFHLLDFDFEQHFDEMLARFRVVAHHLVDRERPRLRGQNSRGEF